MTNVITFPPPTADQTTVSAFKFEDAQRVEQGRKRLFAKYPAFNDPQRFNEFLTDVSDTLIDVGFTPDEIRNITDFRWLDALHQTSRKAHERMNVFAFPSKH